MKNLISALLLLTLFVFSSAYADVTMHLKSDTVVVPVADCCYQNNIIFSEVGRIATYDLAAIQKGTATVTFTNSYSKTDTAGYSPVVLSSRGSGANATTYAGHTLVSEACIVTGKLTGSDYYTQNWNVTASPIVLSGDTYTQTVTFTCRFGW